MRKLVSVQTINSLSPIEGADRIELAGILGWNVVVPKGQFNTGDKCVYFEIDSFLPIDEKFEFLRSTSFKKNPIQGEGFLIKTKKIRGAISQGLVMRLPDLGLDDLPVGTDVTDQVCVREWAVVEMASSSGTIIGDLPFGVPYTDETRIQVLPDILDEFGGNGDGYYITTKMDGSSHTVMIDENGIIHCTSHNRELKDDDTSAFWRLIKKMGIPKKLKVLQNENSGKMISVQGELCGPGIQKNRLKLAEPHWYVFTVNVGGERLGLTETMQCANDLGAEMVPVEELGENLKSVYHDTAGILERARGEYPNGGPKEGIVIRPIIPKQSPMLGTWLSIKAINNEYLL